MKRLSAGRELISTEQRRDAPADSALATVVNDSNQVQRPCGESDRPHPEKNEARRYSSPVCYASEFPGYFGETGT